ncbi:MAG: DUF2330 domain-containing protein [Pseudomonadota bacterium]
MKHFFALAALGVTLIAGSAAHAFCGFYVARADTKLFNQASQVVLVRDGNRTVLTMANDYQGDAEDFAVVIPVPTVLEREQINVAEPTLIEHLDAYTSPRLVEYHDPDPCARIDYLADRAVASEAMPRAGAMRMQQKAGEFGVTIDAEYTVGEYDILILSADDSKGLVTWLTQNGYRLPDGAEPVVNSYLRQGLKFFVAKVNLEEQAALGYRYLRPIQVAFESPRFSLPIRLGTVNAKGKQDLYVYALTRTGRVETANYRTVRIPSNVEIPEYVADEFGSFYQAMFAKALNRENDRAVFLEYAWDMAWCDPCAADPLTRKELSNLGVFWLGEGDPRRLTNSPAQNVFVTRLHLRYDGKTFPADLRFQETGDRSNFQGRYVVRRAFTGDTNCAAGEAYRKSLVDRREREAQQLASLTGWPLADILEQMPADVTPEEDEPWWRRLWGRG